MIVVSCEHAGSRVPATFADLFSSRAARRALNSHRGYDPGALAAARYLARVLDAPLLIHTTTRLLVEVNRSIGHSQLFSEFTRDAGQARQARMLNRHYLLHRQRVMEAISTAAKDGPVLHLGVHSFTPQLHEDVRSADIGLLYDPKRPLEQSLCRRWQKALATHTCLRVRRNYPYRGDSDGLTTTLRQEFAPARYLGIEVEINQALLTGAAGRRATALFKALAEGLLTAGV